MEYIQRHIKETPIPIHVRAPQRSFPPGLWEVIERTLAKRPGDRFPSAAEFGAALSAVLTAPSRASTPRPPSVAPGTQPITAPAVPVVSQPRPQPSIEPPPAPPTSPLPFIVLGIAALLAVVGLGALAAAVFMMN
jgi:serine/threonine-protein kinase